MLGPMGSEIMRIFRLLSPDEIDEYVETSKKVKISAGVSASKVVGSDVTDVELEFGQPASQQASSKAKEDFSDENLAEIIPIRSDLSGPEEEVQYDKAERSPGAYIPKKEEVTDLESMGILSANTIKHIEKNRIEEIRNSSDSTTMFLLKEREKMRSSKKKIICQTAYKSYKSNSEQDTVQYTDEDTLQEDQATGARGILVNKKHF